MIKKATILILLLFLPLTGCMPVEKHEQRDHLAVYTSVYPLQYIVERLGGDTIDTYSVYPPGVDAHTYEPASKVITSLAKSDAFIYIGKGMEGFASQAAQALSSQPVHLVEIGKHEELFTKETHHHDHDDDGHHHGDYDPHIWLDPIRMIDMATIIKDELIAINPNDAALYKKNLIDLTKDFQELDQQYKQLLEKKQNKKILVSHAAYGYWEERYHIEQMPISGLSSTEEPSQKDLVKIVEQAKENHLDYVIFEQNASNRVSEIIQHYIGAEALTIHNLAVLNDQDIQNKEDYLSLMLKNLNTLDQATQ